MHPPEIQMVMRHQISGLATLLGAWQEHNTLYSWAISPALAFYLLKEKEFILFQRLEDLNPWS